MPFSKSRSSGSRSQGFTSYTAKRQEREAKAAAPAPAVSESGYDIAGKQRQINNAIARLEDAGFKVEDADKRNWFEKATNLPEGQNWFFDALDILGRPGQAVLGAAKAYQDADSPSEILRDAGRGFTGKLRTRGADIVRDAGVENKLAQTIAGFGLEVLADPTSYIPGAAFAKAGKLGGTAVKTGAKATYRTAERIPGFGRFSENRIRPAAESIKNGLGYMFKPDYKIEQTLSGGKSGFLKNLDRKTENSRRYMQEQTLEKVSQTAKNAGGIKAGEEVGRVLEAPLKQFEDVPAYNLPNGTVTTSKKDLKEAVSGHRQRIAELENGVQKTQKDLDSQISQAARGLDKLDRDIRRVYQPVENKKLRTLRKGKESRTPEQMQELASQRAFKELSPSPAFNLLLQRRDELKQQLDSLREVRKTTGQAEGAEIKQLNGNINAIKESAQNPITIQRELKRPAREMPKSEAINSAAVDLMNSNKTIRDFATKNGIDIPELQGYMTHVWSQEERALRKKKPVHVDQGRLGTANPNKSILKQRKLTGSAEDVNERLGRKFFEPNAFYASAIGQKRLIDYIHAVSFRRKVLSNPDFAVPYEKGMDIPKDAEVIDSNNYSFLKDEGDILDGVVQADKIGGKYVVTKQAKQLLDRYQRVNTDEGTKAFLKAFDTVQSFWKRGQLFSLGYHIRNQAGAMFNNYVSGMNPVDLSKYTVEGFKEVGAAIGGKESKLFNEYRRQGLSSSGLSQVEFAKYGEEPERAIERTVDKMSAKGFKKYAKKATSLFETSREVGDFFDQANRFALYKYSREKLKMSPEKAAEKVREVQFDYSKTTPFEKNVVARTVPFYRWMRNNIPFQIKALISNPKKYANVNKIRLNAQDAAGLDDDNIPGYMKENFTVPVSGENGKGRMLGLNLPLSDLTKLSNPLKVAVDAITPIAKTPVELGTNFNMFRRKPIQKFAGQEKKYDIPGVGEIGLPIKAAYVLEQATGQIGRGLSGYLQKDETKDQDTLNRLPSFGISSLTKPYDAEAYAYYSKLDQLRQLQDLLMYIEQQTGSKPRTVNEIKKDSR